MKLSQILKNYKANVSVMRILTHEYDDITITNTLASGKDAILVHFITKNEEQKFHFHVTLTPVSTEHGIEMEVCADNIDVIANLPIIAIALKNICSAAGN